MAKAAEETVSVIVPVYNAGIYLELALLSIRAQTHKNLQIICVNDGSTDGSLAELQRQAAEDGRITVIDQPNRGYGAACNAGLAAARGTWVALVEPDDWIEPAMYGSMLAFAHSLAKVPDVVKTPYVRVICADTPQEERRACKCAGRVHPSHQPFAIADAPMLLRFHPSIWSALYRRDFLESRGIRFREEQGSAWTDNPFMMETLGAASIAYLDRAFYCYRETDDAGEQAYLAKNPQVPLQRCAEMLDAADRYGLTDAAVLGELYRRVFNYVERLQATALDPARLQVMAAPLLERMDASVVLESPQIPLAAKRYFTQVRGIAAGPLNPLPHWGYVLAERVDDVRKAGAGNALRMLRSRLASRHSR